VADENVIRQKSIAGGPAFKFHERHLEYSGAGWGFRARYEDIAGPGHYLRTQTGGRLVGFAFVYVIAVAGILVYREHFPFYAIEGIPWVVRSVGALIAGLIVVCGLLYWLMYKEFTVVPARNGNILIVRDKSHDSIVVKIQAARMESLRRLAVADPANSPEEEVLKLKWLRDEHAITGDEYASLCSQVDH